MYEISLNFVKIEHNPRGYTVSVVEVVVMSMLPSVNDLVIIGNAAKRHKS